LERTPKTSGNVSIVSIDFRNITTNFCKITNAEINSAYAHFCSGTEKKLYARNLDIQPNCIIVNNLF